MAKEEAEYCDRLSIFRLKQDGFLGLGVRNGWMKWIDNGGAWKSRIGFTVNIGYGLDRVTLRYTHTSCFGGEKTDMNYDVELTATPCHYGGFRYWFRCPLVKNGSQCRRRIGVLYGWGKYFGCRSCQDIAYGAQKQGGLCRFTSITTAKIERYREKVRRKYYRGVMTRKYRRLLIMEQRLSTDMMRADSTLVNSLR